MQARSIMHEIFFNERCDDSQAVSEMPLMQQRWIFLQNIGLCAKFWSFLWNETAARPTSNDLDTKDIFKAHSEPKVDWLFSRSSAPAVISISLA